MLRKIIIFSGILLFATGCSSNQNKETHQNQLSEEEKRGQLTKQLRVNEQTDTNREKNPPAIKNKNIHEAPLQENQTAYTNESTIEITKKLMERNDIRAAQVSMTKEKVFVGLILERKIDTEIRSKVEAVVRASIPNKQIVIYSDEAEWDQKKEQGRLG